ncbi:MAG: GntR family transcriptional regulator [Anaerolineaceae bacterium]|nr:MAG: GntR family transcriptional regulator [Anaerolineaceae bacterium]
MLKTSSSKPYYEQIKEYILHRINAGELKPNHQIPSERVLSDQFGVSRLTVSKAIKELVFEGKLYTQVGKGTFVSAEAINQTLDHLTSFSEEMSKRGQTPSSRVLEQALIRADERIAGQLQITPGAALVLLKRARLADGQPVALETTYLIADYCVGILEAHDFRHESLYHVLRNSYNLRLMHAEQELEARQPTAEEARVLKVDQSTPILHITRVTYIEHERPIEYVESAYRGDRYKFRARLVQV